MSQATPNELIPRVFPKIKLNAHGCLSLVDLIDAFQTPITEEQAWALCYQSVRCGQNILTNASTRQECSLVTSSEQLFIHKDGTIHVDSFLNQTQIDGPVRIKCSKERKIISNLAVVIFLALDYGIPGDVERTMSEDLESLLDAMVSAAGTHEMSQVERYDGTGKNCDRRQDNYNSSTCDFKSIIQACAKRLIGPSRSQNDKKSFSLVQICDYHYKAVCRAYVGEALELWTFLQTVMRGRIDQSLNANSEKFPISVDYDKGWSLNFENFNKLDFADWARLWVQVIRDLRQGVKLKEIEFRRGPPIEYVQTPYEILMDDIRTRRYTLKKVTTNKEDVSPCQVRTKDDAHALILEFIRSRPQLKKVDERILDPLPAKSQTPVEKLMDSIRQTHKLSRSNS